MIGRFCIETNLMTYAIDGSDPRKQAAAPLSITEALAIYHRLIEPLWRIQSSRELLDAVLDLHHRDRNSWLDSLIVRTATQGGCKTLLTEDLQHGRTIRGVKILDPFR